MITTHIHHRLNGQGHASLQTRAPPRGSEIRNLWRFVHLATNSMSDKISDHGKPSFFSTLLHSMGDIRKAVTDLSLGDALKEGFFCSLEQALNLGVYLTHW